MTAHRVLWSDEKDGICLSCSHPDCGWTERRFHHTDTAGDAAREHETEMRIEQLEAVVRQTAEFFEGTDAPLGVAARGVLDAWNDELSAA